MAVQSFPSVSMQPRCMVPKRRGRQRVRIEEQVRESERRVSKSFSAGVGSESYRGESLWRKTSW